MTSPAARARAPVSAGQLVEHGTEAVIAPYFAATMTADHFASQCEGLIVGLATYAEEMIGGPIPVKSVRQMLPDICAIDEQASGTSLLVARNTLKRLADRLNDEAGRTALEGLTVTPDKEFHHVTEFTRQLLTAWPNQEQGLTAARNDDATLESEAAP